MLSIEQQAAVTAFGPATVILAGAGSGKTRVLVAGLVSLLEQWSAPEIALLTFTRRAALDMQERASNETTQTLDGLYAGTFHAVAARCLREAGQQFSILDEQAAREVIEQLGRSVSDERMETDLAAPTTEQIAPVFALAIANQTRPEDLLDQYPERLRDRRGWIGEVFNRYQQTKLQEHWYDYADLLAQFVTLVEHDAGPALRAVLVDEAQDLDQMQRQLLQTWRHAGVWIIQVGDPNQSIYAWRGAAYQSFIKAVEEPQIRRATLSDNYRSTPEIVAAAQTIIAQARLTIPSRSTRPSGAKPRLLIAHDPADEQAQAIDWIRTSAEAGSGAVIARAHQPLNDLARCCRQAGLPIALLGRGADDPIEQVTHWLLGLFRLAGAPRDRIGWLHLAQLYTTDSDDQTALINHWHSYNDPLAAFADSTAQAETLVRALEESSAASWRQLLLGPLQKHIHAWSRQTGQAILGPLLDRGNQIGQGDAYLSAVADNEAPDDHIHLTTIHGAKGLEWSSVLLLRLGPGSLPAAAARSAEQLAEERRLLYVALTRAQDHLTVLAADWLCQTNQGFLADAAFRECFQRG